MYTGCGQMSSVNHRVVADRLTRERLDSYLLATGGSVEDAIDLYDWNTRAGAGPSRGPRPSRGSLPQRDGRCARRIRLEPRVAASLVPARASLSRSTVVPDQGSNIRCPRTRNPARPDRVHGKVIAELGSGFWRYLCEPAYHTSLWVPALTAVFALHPSARNTRRVRADVGDRMQRLHFLRNRIAHHEPIHRRDLAHDHDQLLDVIG